MEFNGSEIQVLHQKGLGVYRKWYLVVNEGPPIIKHLVHELRSAHTVFRFLLDEESNPKSALTRLNDNQRNEFDILVDGCITALEGLEKKYNEIVVGEILSEDAFGEENDANYDGGARRRHGKSGLEPWAVRATKASAELKSMQNNLSTFVHLLLVLLAMNDASKQSASQERIEVLLKSMMDYGRNQQHGLPGASSATVPGANPSIFNAISRRRSVIGGKNATSQSPSSLGTVNRLSILSARGSFSRDPEDVTQPEVLTVRMASNSNSPHVINLIFPTQKNTVAGNSKPSEATQNHDSATPSISENVTSPIRNGSNNTTPKSGGTSSQEMGSQHETVEVTPGQTLQFSGDKETVDAVSALLERVQRAFINLGRGGKREDFPAKPMDLMLVKPSLSKLLMTYNLSDELDGPNERLEVYGLKDWLWLVKWWLTKARFEAEVYREQAEKSASTNEDAFGESSTNKDDDDADDELEVENFLHEQPYGKSKLAMLKVIWLLGDILDPYRITQVLSQEDYNSLRDLQQSVITELDTNEAFLQITEFADQFERLLLRLQQSDEANVLSEEELANFQVLQDIHPKERAISVRSNSVKESTDKSLLEIFVSVEYNFQPRKTLLDATARYKNMLVVTCSQEDPHAAVLKIVNAEGTVVKKIPESQAQSVHKLPRCFTVTEPQIFSFAFPNPRDYTRFEDMVRRIKAGHFFTGPPVQTWKLKNATYDVEASDRPSGRWSHSKCDIELVETNLPGHSWGSKRRQIILKRKRREQINRIPVDIPLHSLRFEVDADSQMYRIRMSWSHNPRRVASTPASATSFDVDMPSNFRHCVEFEGDVVVNDAYHDQRLPRKSVLSNNGGGHTAGPGSPPMGLPVIKCSGIVEPNSGLTYYQRTNPATSCTSTSWTCPFESVKMSKRDHSGDLFAQEHTLDLEFFTRDDAMGFYAAVCQSDKLLATEEQRIAYARNETKSNQIFVFESAKFPGQPRVLETCTVNGEEVIRTSFVTSATSFSNGAFKGLLSHRYGSRRPDEDSATEDYVGGLDPAILNLETLRGFPLIPIIRPHYWKIPFGNMSHCRFKSLTLTLSRRTTEEVQASNASHVSRMSIRHWGGKIASKAPSIGRSKPTIFQARNGKISIYIDRQRSRLRFLVFNEAGELQPGFLHFQVLVEPSFHQVWTDVIEAEVSFELNEISSTVDDKLTRADCRRGVLDISFHEREECSQFMDLYEDQAKLSRAVSELALRSRSDTSSLRTSNTNAT